MKLKLLLAAAALLLPGMDFADPAPSAAAPEDVHQVMFLVTIDTKTGVWTHAQVIGGFKDNDACQHAAPAAGTIAATDLAANEIPIVLCPKIDVEKVKATPGQPL